MGVLIEEAVIPDLDTINDDRQRILGCVRRWGGLASDAVLDPACCYFYLPTVDGFIGYRKVFGCAVFFGYPVCSPLDIPELATAFHQACKQEGQRVIYVTVSQRFAK